MRYNSTWLRRNPIKGNYMDKAAYAVVSAVP